MDTATWPSAPSPDDLLERRRFVLHGVRAVLADVIVEDATITCEHGRIVAVEHQVPRPPGSVLGHDLLCLPGLVDTHSDGLEKELVPRRGVRLPTDFALRSYEGRVRAAGITTIFHGVGFEDQERYGRSVMLAHELCGHIAARRLASMAPVDHRVLFRLEARSPNGLDALVSRLREQSEIVDGSPPARPLVSFEDHTPGQGQYRDVTTFAKAIDPSTLAEDEGVEDLIEQMMADAERRRSFADRNRGALAELTSQGRARLLAHDAEDAAGVAEAAEWGAEVVEFPLTVEAAQEARRLDLPVVMGAPNALRGHSHNDNVSAGELVAAGLCDALASDYLPTTMLAAVFGLARAGVVTLPRAIGLVTSGPARVAGLTDRGRIEVGAVADLVLVADDGRWPQVCAVHRARDASSLANT